MMLEGVIRMADMTAGDVMVAAPRMDLLDIDAPLRRAAGRRHRHRHSRFPVYEGERDNIIGILMAKDLLKLQRAPELNLRTLLRPAVFVPESKGLNDLLRDFRSNRNHLAIVDRRVRPHRRAASRSRTCSRRSSARSRTSSTTKDDESSIYTLADGSQRVAGDADDRRRQRGVRRRCCRPTSSTPSAAWSRTSSAACRGAASR